MVGRESFEVPGFLAGAIESGMRYAGRLDLALIYAPNPAGCVASGVFTRNSFCAAPVELCRERLEKHRARAILVNAGIANACTGGEGKTRAIEMARIASEALGCPADSVLVSSTGVIGMQVDPAPVARCMPALVGNLRPHGWRDAAKAIMTTDTVEKTASAKINLGAGLDVTIGGIAKGSGMIAPDMATLLVFVCTDANLSAEVLDYWALAGANRSFNCITVDGDTSTNDTLIVLASGAAANPLITDIGSSESLAFGGALTAVLRDLAIQVVMDAEGATKLIQIEVSGAADRESARKVAFTVANSPLVKTAFFGQDANWGRIVAAAGRAGVPLAPGRVGLFFEDLCVFENGAPVLDEKIEQKASRIFKQKEIRVLLRLGQGDASFTAWTCDLSLDYVKINSSYRS
ncbi:MAG TPA: bifunctional glutamate N-acetyltransferase/amino-acid acetyltransferase ArgJ [Syntrophobacteraceae bacterium]|nr:bifunctional glutamate N-acetyltransferase/amino-acid acetyltransferase ArgJ [Syntrophobacteraceae bacterium]